MGRRVKKEKLRVRERVIVRWEYWGEEQPKKKGSGRVEGRVTVGSTLATPHEPIPSIRLYLIPFSSKV